MATAPIQSPCTNCDARSDHSVRPDALVSPAPSGQGQPLHPATQADFANRTGHDLSGVRVHTDTAAAASAQAIGARAYTVGHNIVFAAGAFAPGTPQGQRLLAHELTHVVQQRTGLVRPGTIQRQDAGTPVVSTPASLVDAPAVPVAQAPPEVQRQLAYATTVLARRPLGEDEQRRIDEIIAGTPVLELIHERDSKRRELSDVSQWLAYYQATNEKLARGEVLAGGVGADEEMMGRLRADTARLTTELEHLDGNIQAELLVLGIPDEAALLRTVEEEFPLIWIEQGKQIAYGMLDVNRETVLAEQQRYPPDSCTVDTAGLQAADAQILAGAQQHSEFARQRDIKLQEVQQAQAALEQGRRLEQWAAQPGGLPAGVPPDVNELQDRVTMLSAEATTLEEQLVRAQIRTDALRKEHGAAYPILLVPDYRPGVFQGSEEQVALLTGRWTEDLLENIEDTRKNIAEGAIKVWDLQDIPALTYQRLGVPADSVLGRAVEHYIAHQRSDDRLLSIARAVFEVAVTIAATIATLPAGGVGGLVVGAAFGVGHLVEDVQSYRAERAAEHVAMDPEIADISLNEPELLPIVLDIASLGLDTVMIVRAVRPAARALMATRDVAAFSREVERVAPEAAEALQRSARRRLGSSVVEGAEAGEESSLRGRLFAKSTTTGTTGMKAGEGVTDKFGNITYSTLGSQTQQDLARFHEQVHSFLSPKFTPLRNFRADIGIWAYKRIHLLKYIEEAMAETYAQLRVVGLRGLPDGIAFPIANGYVTIGRLATEAAIGTVVAGGATYYVYVTVTEEQGQPPTQQTQVPARSIPDR